MLKSKKLVFTLFGATAGLGIGVIVKDFLAGPDFDKPVELKGKVAVVTGANSGIGYEVAMGLAEQGAKVYLACRDRKRCERAREDIALATRNKNLYCRYCDLSSQDSIKRFAKRISQDEEKVDILINNAGIMWSSREITEDGVESQLGVNHMGHFLLTNLLLDKLKEGVPSRIVNVASTAHYRGKINVEDLNSENKYGRGAAYNQSKLANVLFTLELARRLQDTGVTVNAVHPGIVSTNIIRTQSYATSFLWWLVKPFAWPFLKTAYKGAQPVLYVALDPDLENVTGKYFNRFEEKEPSPEAQNKDLALWLWLVSEKWTHLAEAQEELGVTPAPNPVHVNNTPTALNTSDIRMGVPETNIRVQNLHTS